MADTVKDAIANNKQGFYIGQRLVLPFRCQVIKMITDNEIYTEFVGSKNVKISQDPKNTSIYFRSAGRLSNMVDTYKVVKMVICEWEDDITVLENHIKVICKMEGGHVVMIHEPTDDMLFIE